MGSIKDKIRDKALAFFDKRTDDATFWESVQHFKSSEFDSRYIPGSGKFMRRRFIRMLDKARGIAGIPFPVSSGARDPKHNEEAGGEENSAHLIRVNEWVNMGASGETLSKSKEVKEVPEAADIEVNGSRERFLVVESAIKAGFKRIGVAKNFVHLDADLDKPQEVVWLY